MSNYISQDDMRLDIGGENGVEISKYKIKHKKAK